MTNAGLCSKLHPSKMRIPLVNIIPFLNGTLAVSIQNISGVQGNEPISFTIITQVFFLFLYMDIKVCQCICKKTILAAEDDYDDIINPHFGHNCSFGTKEGNDRVTL